MSLGISENTDTWRKKKLFCLFYYSFKMMRCEFPHRLNKVNLNAHWERLWFFAIWWIVRYPCLHFSHYGFEGVSLSWYFLSDSAYWLDYRLFKRRFQIYSSFHVRSSGTSWGLSRLSMRLFISLVHWGDVVKNVWRMSFIAFSGRIFALMLFLAARYILLPVS